MDTGISFAFFPYQMAEKYATTDDEKKTVKNLKFKALGSLI